MKANLTRFAWLSIAAALLTIGLKTTAYWVTGSIGLLSDALESLVNLVAAIMALAMLTVAARPADEIHAFGYSKAEYFSSGLEGALILLAAVSIVWTAIPRFLVPQPLEHIAIGLAISVVASAVNFGVARVLMNAGKEYRSITLEADAHHLMADVWTSAGVVLGVGAIALTGWLRLDPIIALIVAVNILRTGAQLLSRSIRGLLDAALPAAEQDAINQVLRHYESKGIQFHALRTRQAGTGHLSHCTSWYRRIGPFSAGMTCLNIWNGISVGRFQERISLLTWSHRATPPLGKTSRWIARILREAKTNEPSDHRGTQEPQPETASASPHLANHVYQRRLTLFYDLHRLAQRLDEIFRLRDRSGAPAAVGARHGAEVDVRVFDTDADGLVCHWAVAHHGNPFLMLFVVKIRAIAANNDQQWNLMVDRRPEGADGEQQAAVGLDIDAELPGAFECQGRAERSRQAIAQTTALGFS
jgi:cation diffusion facilitator family transporter